MNELSHDSETYQLAASLVFFPAFTNDKRTAGIAAVNESDKTDMQRKNCREQQSRLDPPIIFCNIFVKIASSYGRSSCSFDGAKILLIELLLWTALVQLLRQWILTQKSKVHFPLKTLQVIVGIRKSMLPKQLQCSK